MFTDTLNKVTHGFVTHTPLRMIQSLTLKSKDSACKFKDRGGEEIPSHKVLLLVLVRLIHADPMLMLYVSRMFQFISCCIFNENKKFI